MCNYDDNFSTIIPLILYTLFYFYRIYLFFFSSELFRLYRPAHVLGGGGLTLFIKLINTEKKSIINYDLLEKNQGGLAEVKVKFI